jgi:ssDNA-binding Zn-finger/Zn-ribbon topoisomerase 1
MREKFMRMMYGRYGMDPYARFLSVLTWILLIVAIVTRRSVGPYFILAAFALILYNYFRIFSKNIYKRSQENTKYLQLKQRVKTSWTGLRNRIRQRKEYAFFRCPNCKILTRVPRGRGKIEITCPKCHTQFIRKT